jgi:hypothetical protein
VLILAEPAYIGKNLYLSSSTFFSYSLQCDVYRKKIRQIYTDMHVILLFVNTVLVELRLRLPPVVNQLFYKGEASLLKIYLHDKFSIYGQFGKFCTE